ncbi:hypothetical protein [Bifidobacterium hapali]|nr:hypothetical protein [Bifidobacterium hapali]
MGDPAFAIALEIGYMQRLFAQKRKDEKYFSGVDSLLAFGYI